MTHAIARLLGWVVPSSRRGRVLAALMVALVAVGLLFTYRGGAEEAVGVEDPRWAELAGAAVFGASHVIYENLPGGVVAAAQRTARFRPLIDAAVEGTDVDPELVEALILLESGGRPEVVVGKDPVNASGLTQILAGTATDFLDMRVDLAESRRLFSEIDEARRTGDRFAEETLRVERREIDERFDPSKAIEGAVRYLVQADDILGREDLALASYHMGIGNLTSVLRAYSGEPNEAIDSLVRERAISYAQVYFDTAPAHNVEAWRELDALSDDSANYVWKLLASREIMRLYRDELSKLEELALRHGAKASAEEVLHPPDETEVFERLDDVRGATGAGDVSELARDPDTTHYIVHRRLGELAPELDGRRRDYAVLRPDALGVLEYIAAEVFELSGDETPLRVTSAARDLEYQRLLVQRNDQATRGYSLHTTGFAFDVLREYGSDEQAQAFQFVLERLSVLGLIAWVREPEAIHITVADGARDRIRDWLVQPTE